MTPRDRALYRLAWVEHCEPKEIAAILHVAEKTVRNRLSKVKRFLIERIRRVTEG